MQEKIQQALDALDATYKDLIVIANNVTDRYFQSVDSIIKELYNKVEDLSDEDIRQSILKLSFTSYSLGETKERSTFKSELADTIKQVAFSEKFNSAGGAVAVRENSAIIDIADKTLVSKIYDYVSANFKTKLDEIHRVVDSLKSVLISRQAMAKNLRQTNGLGDLQ